MISNCGHDENSKYKGGQAGDQTGGEWCVRTWYNRPWDVVLRFPNSAVQNLIADMARAAAKNDAIGYDQGQRETFWTQLRNCLYDPAKITTPCEADCSSGVAAIVKGAGYRLGIASLQAVPTSAYTGNLKSILEKAGFNAYTDTKYRTSDKYLLPGDILLNEKYHVCINLDKGSLVSYQSTNNATVTPSSVKVDAAQSMDKSLAGTYTVTASKLNMRSGAGTGKVIIDILPKGTKVQCYGYYNTAGSVKWLYVKCGDKVGYCSAEYLKK